MSGTDYNNTSEEENIVDGENETASSLNIIDAESGETLPFEYEEPTSESGTEDSAVVLNLDDEDSESAPEDYDDEDSEDGGQEGEEEDESTPIQISGGTGEYTEEGLASLASFGVNIKSGIKLYTVDIDIEDLVIPNIKKQGRTDTIIGLTGVVGEWGVVTPIHTLKLEDDSSFMLLDGLRRVFAATRTGKAKIKAVVWEFEDVEEGKDIANILSLMLNRSQHYRNRELWEQFQILEEINHCSPGLIEFLLQLYPGDAMKLKDIMLADYEYAEIKADFLDNLLTIDAAYKKLTNLRKKENRLAKEDNIVLDTAESIQPDEEGNFDNVSSEQQLGVDQVKELLDLAGEEVGDATLEDLDRTSEVKPEMVQKVGERHPVDEGIKKAVMIRDSFTCQCCGKGGQQWLGVLVYHHIVPVFLGGPDTIANGLTLCSNCHLILHLYSFGKVPVDIKELPEDEKETFKKIFKYGNVIIDGMKKTGMNKDKAYKADAGSRRHLMPGEGLKENTEAFNEAQKGGSAVANTSVEDEATA